MTDHGARGHDAVDSGHPAEIDQPPAPVYWSEPEPATRAEKAVAVATAAAIALLMLCAVGHLFLFSTGIVPLGTSEWGFPDVSYLALMTLMSTLVITHSALSEDAIRPWTIVIISSAIGGIGTLLALARGWLLAFGAAFAEEDWVTYSVLGATAISILPFALPFAVGVILVRNDFEPPRWRVRAVSLAVAISAAIVVLAALAPRWAGAP
jgi:hypothetical protein